MSYQQNSGVSYILLIPQRFLPDSCYLPVAGTHRLLTGLSVYLNGDALISDDTLGRDLFSSAGYSNGDGYKN